MISSQLQTLLDKPLCKNGTEGFLWLEEFYNTEKSSIYNQNVYRLDRMNLLLNHFDNPHQKIPAIHIAGSKGKGSTAAYCSSILNSYSLKVGLYTSPHIYSYKERITSNGEFFSDSIYTECINKIQKGLPQFLKHNLDKITLPPTLFELLTLLAFLVFVKASCEVLVIEVGLGGRLDATNLINPILSIITQIEKEHTAYLGKSLKKIATQKAGIIKEGRPFLLTKQKNVVAKTFIKTAKRLSAPIYKTDYQLKKHSISLQTIESWKLPIPGEVQKINIKNALAGATIFLPLLKQEIDIKKLKAAIESTKLRGRMEQISSSPNIWVDGAHTPLSFKNAVKTFNSLYHNGKNCLVFSALEDKDVKKMIRLALKGFDTICFSSIDSFRKQDPKKLFEIANKIKKRALLFYPDFFKTKIFYYNSSSEALKSATNMGENILVSGSFYLVSQILNELEPAVKE